MKNKLLLSAIFTILCLGSVSAQGNKEGNAGGRGDGVGINSIKSRAINKSLPTGTSNLSKASSFILVNSSGATIINTPIVQNIDPLEIYGFMLSKGQYSAIYKDINGNTLDIITFDVK